MGDLQPQEAASPVILEILQDLASQEELGPARSLMAARGSPAPLKSLEMPRGLLPSLLTSPKEPAKPDSWEILTANVLLMAPGEIFKILAFLPLFNVPLKILRMPCGLLLMEDLLPRELVMLAILEILLGSAILEDLGLPLW